ncbi:MAG: hypothetical protein RL754_832 [Bacteroidota bacterium]|jgi:hypothetical protein
MQKERKVPVKKIGKHILIIGVLLLSLFAQGQDSNGSINASASRTTVGLNEPFRVVFTTDIREGSIQAPNFDNFIVVRGPYRGQQTQIINGNASFRKELSFELVAEKEGTFTIAPATINIRGQLRRSNTLEITVKSGVKRENSLSEKAKNAFQVDILTSKKEVYVGEPVVMLYRATLFEPVRDMNIIQAPNFENVLQQQLDFKQEQRIEIVDGKRATVLDFDKRLLIPNKPGILGGQELKIAGQVQVPTGRVDFWGMPLTKFVQDVSSAEIPAVKIKPLPSPKPEDFSGAVGSFKVVRELDKTALNGDESLTLKIRIEGSGNFNTISVPDLIPPQGFDVYDPKFNENIRYTERGVRGYKELEYLLVPQFKGEFIIPEMQWTFFNSETGDYETVLLEEETIHVNSNVLSARDTSTLAPVDKREVTTIDDDIRYLQTGDFKPFVDLRLRRISLLFVLLTALAWVLQFINVKRKGPSSEALASALEKKVLKAFAGGDEARFAIMLNAVEQRIMERGIAREAISSDALEMYYGEERTKAIRSLMERCQLAQYAPISIGSTQQLETDFKALWKTL